MKKSSQFLVLILAALTYLPFSALADEANGTSEDSMNHGSSSERAFRRVIIEGSLANAGYEGGDSTRYSRPNGYSAGVLFDLIGTRNLVLETGGLYRQFGTTYNNGLGNNTFTANYISIPVDAKYYFSGQEVTSFYLKGGVMGSTLVSNNTEYATPTTRVGARSWETAFLAGIGGKFNLSASTDLLIEADYNRSIDSVLKNQSVFRSDLAAVVGVAVNM